MAETQFINFNWGERPDMVVALQKVGRAISGCGMGNPNDQAIILETLLAALYLGAFKKRVSAETFAWGVKTNIENFINDTGL